MNFNEIFIYFGKANLTEMLFFIYIQVCSAFYGDHPAWILLKALPGLKQLAFQGDEGVMAGR